mmetsp:Transcript_18576/g.46650  ORF Transcript_18576/g.46650 Transcript_18576/m.46650 type:complete len:151 (+) Transcript_18576:103-555(+)
MARFFIARRTALTLMPSWGKWQNRHSDSSTQPLRLLTNLQGVHPPTACSSEPRLGSDGTEAKEPFGAAEDEVATTAAPPNSSGPWRLLEDCHGGGGDGGESAEKKLAAAVGLCSAAFASAAGRPPPPPRSTPPTPLPPLPRPPIASASRS